MLENVDYLKRIADIVCANLQQICRNQFVKISNGKRVDQVSRKSRSNDRRRTRSQTETPDFCAVKLTVAPSYALC